MQPNFAIGLVGVFALVTRVAAARSSDRLRNQSAETRLITMVYMETPF